METRPVLLFKQYYTPNGHLHKFELIFLKFSIKITFKANNLNAK